MNIILASQSPRRRELLQFLNMDFIIRVADVDETTDPKQSPKDEVARLSRLKAEAIAHDPADIVIAADTIVVLDDRILGKPRNEADAKAMLTALSGRWHQVMTGLTVLQGEKQVSCTEITDVCFRELKEEEIVAYIATKEPMDKAGAYGIQSGAAPFVERIHGDFYNVVGLPVCRLSQILKEFMEETK